MTKKNNPRIGYGFAFICLLLIEVIIALYVRDDFIRPYGGDILVTVLICCFMRIIFPDSVRLLPLWVFLFAAGVEIAQYFDFVSLLGLSNSTFFSILLGSTFSWADIVCYAAGCLIFALVEHLFKKRT